MLSIKSKAVLLNWVKSKHGQNLTTETGSRAGKKRKCLKSLLRSQCGKCPNHTASERVKLILNVLGILNAFLRDLAKPSSTKSHVANLLFVDFLSALKISLVALDLLCL